MNPIMDFLSQRTMMVEFNGHNSSLYDMPVGCVQGSVLGPKLFSIYCKDLGTSLPSGSHVVSYADDSYITINSPNLVELKEKIENSLRIHEAFMESVGMVINKQKTELVNFSKRDAVKINLENGISSSDSFKALGITFSHNLSWESHITNTMAKTSRTINSIKFLRRYISTDNALKVATSQYFGQAYYGASIWLNKTLNYSQWDRLNRQHYRAIRASVGDFARKIPILDIIAKRATPKEWSSYITSSTAIKLYNNNNTRIGKQLIEAGYINDRRPDRAVFIDRSNKLVGQQHLTNRLQCMNDINFPWIGISSADSLRRQLKTTFFRNGL